MCIVETLLDDSVFDNELTVSNYCLVRNRHVGVLLYIRDGLSNNVTFTGPENLEMVGITLYNGNNNLFCLCTLYWSTCHHSSCIATAVYSSFFTES